ADLYHVHYLLQDCYLALKFGKHPVVGHAHGSDLRSSLKHRVWGRIVRYNLKRCDKVLVSTPDILDIAREYRVDAEYLPNPVDTSIFYPKPLKQHSGKKKVLIASDSNWGVKGTDLAIKALSRVKDEVDVSIIRYGVDFDRTVALASSLGLRLNVLPKVPHDRVSEYCWDADVVVDQFKFGALGMVSLEAIACGRHVVTYVSSEYREYADLPIKDVNIVERIVESIKFSSKESWKEEYNYLIKHHTPQKVANRIKDTYMQLLDV
ncbi:MAG: glycosyltransferase, partial [Candidatus Bathyarchaeota archaeon]|nr:glycosyltransferase [Candidatus Bathyarchaeota archaeon]